MILQHFFSYPSPFIENEYRKFFKDYVSSSSLLPFIDHQDQFLRMRRIPLGKLTARQSQVAWSVATSNIHYNPQNKEQSEPSAKLNREQKTIQRANIYSLYP